LCGGTHVRSTAEIGAFVITTETSSAANVRRIEAVTGPVALDLLRHHDRLLRDAAGQLRARPEDVPDRVADLGKRVKQLEKQLKAGAPAAADFDEIIDVDGARLIVTQVEVSDPKSLPDLADRAKARVGEAGAVVLGSAVEGRVHLLVAVTPALVERGVKAGQVVKTAAQIVGGGGGGRDTMAQAGGRDPGKLPDALEAARAEIERALSG